MPLSCKTISAFWFLAVEMGKIRPRFRDKRFPFFWVYRASLFDVMDECLKKKVLERIMGDIIVTRSFKCCLVWSYN